MATIVSGPEISRPFTTGGRSAAVARRTKRYVGRHRMVSLLHMVLFALPRRMPIARFSRG
ncbi:MAG: hypothetical protein ACK5MP_11390 [Nostocoides sp.]